jgi:hypothetical protein
MLRQEGNLAVLDDEGVLLQIDRALVPLEHVEAEEEVDILVLCGQKRVSDGEKGFQRKKRRASRIVNEHWRNRSLPIFNCAECTLPKILLVPTPRAIPAKRVSRRRMIPQRSAQVGDTVEGQDDQSMGGR